MVISIVGRRGGTNVGGAFERAAVALDLPCEILEPREALEASPLVRHVNWRLRGRRPAGLRKFGQRLVERCLLRNTKVVIVTGEVGVSAGALRRLRAAGMRTANYLTDDPWNRTHRASWFLESLAIYSVVFSPRHQNLSDLHRLGCANAQYLPFAYDPEIHFAEHGGNGDTQLQSDILFVGGGDSDRVRAMLALCGAGLSVAIYGAYWGIHPRLRKAWRGYADLSTLRRATVAARACLCLTRKANRDDHTMRSYEVPAMKGIILAEKTTDHCEMFGNEGECALFFQDTSEMIEKARWLISHQAEARQMAERAYLRVTGGANTYRDRLETILKACSG
jgi:spore maturation protein CgeB